jgi:hypothetical protein
VAHALPRLATYTITVWWKTDRNIGENVTDDARQQRKIDKQKDSEARWLQKMLFAAGKAREAREKLAEVTGDDLNPLITLSDGTKVPLDTIEEIVQKRVDSLMDALGRTVRH